MSEAAGQIDQWMEEASQALVERNYGRCEDLCVRALAAAREAEDFDRLARILLPLQESRRQRRQIAEEAGVVVLNGPQRAPAAILDDHPAGCLLLTDPPYAEADADALRALARRRHQAVEVLRVDQAGLKAMFLRGLEDRGDALLAKVPRHQSAIEKVDRLLAELDRVGDHEIAHQRLAEAARQTERERQGRQEQ